MSVVTHAPASRATVARRKRPDALHQSELRPADLTAIVDTREQTPLDLAPLQTVSATLRTGDYSLRGLEAGVRP